MVIDIVIIALIIIFSFIGMKKGFVNSIFSVFGILFTLLFAYVITSPISQFLNNNFGLNEHITNWLTETKLIQKIADAENGFWLVIFKFFKIDSASIVSSFGAFIVSAICYVFSYIVIRIGIKIIMSSLGAVINSNVVISKADRFLGLFVGAAKGLLIVSVLAFLIVSLNNTSFSQVIGGQVENSDLIKVFGDGATTLIKNIGSLF